MNKKHDTLNLSHEETDRLVDHFSTGIPLDDETKRNVLAKLILLKEDHTMPPHVDGRVDPKGYHKWLLWMLKYQT